MAKRSQVQDNLREKQIAHHCQLIHANKRYGHDAEDDLGHKFELKSGTTGNYISTARDVGLHTIEKWKSMYWIFASHKTNDPKSWQMEELWIAHPNDLEEFFQDVSNKINREWELVSQVLCLAKKSNNFSSLQMGRFEKICTRGVSLNDPRIKMDLVRSTGTRLDHQESDAASLQLREFVSMFPLCEPKITERAYLMDCDMFEDN